MVWLLKSDMVWLWRNEVLFWCGCKGVEGQGIIMMRLLGLGGISFVMVGMWKDGLLL